MLILNLIVKAYHLGVNLYQLSYFVSPFALTAHAPPQGLSHSFHPSIICIYQRPQRPLHSKALVLYCNPMIER